jgi:fatty-acyl-CoA synthase
MRAGGFATLVDALDHAAGARTGMTFHGPRGEVVEALGYARLAEEARDVGARLAGLGLPPGARVGIVAETEGDFARAFLGAVVAGLVPCPMPLPSAFGASDVYAGQLRRIARVAEMSALVLPEPYRALVADTLPGDGLAWIGPVGALDAAPAALPPAPGPEEIAYLQFSSGTTRAPRGVAVTHRALMANITAMAGAGLALGPEDRGISWLPFYHDMGLVGCMLLPLATQMSIDYLATRDFIRRPGLWPTMMSRARATLSYAPSFGYRLAATRARLSGPLDLSAWRIAGIGGDMVRPDDLAAFTGVFGAHGFREGSFLPSYGMAELALGLTFAPPGGGAVAERLDPAALESGEARPDPTARGARAFVACGPPLPEHAVAIRDAAGRDLGPRRVGRIHARGPSVMQGYFRDDAASAEVLSPDGWLDTGDTGYLTETGALVITGRAKDLIIVNGRNIWPQDIEWTLETRLEGVRQGGIAAFPVERQGGEGLGVVLETRAGDGDARAALRRAADALVREVFGLSADLAFARPGGLPRTSSGKLSRAQARAMFVAGRFER